MDTNDYVANTVDRVFKILGRANITGLRTQSEPFRRDLTGLYPKLSAHHFLEMGINHDKVTAITNTDSNSTIISRGACKALGIKPQKNVEPTVY